MAAEAASTDSLLGRLRDGDQAAVGELYDTYGSACYGMAMRVLHDDTLAQDVVQEVFLALWKNPGSYRPERGSLKTWVLSMAHHKAVDVVRREEAHRRRNRESLESLDPVQSRESDTADSISVRDALRHLAPAQREAIVLAYFGGYTQTEVASLTNTPLGTVKSRMLTGMRQLRDELKTEGGRR